MSLKAIFFLLTLFSCQILGPSVGKAAESQWDSIGIRAGANLFDPHKTSRGDFELYELFADYALPWRWGSSTGLEWRTRLDASAGVLKREGDKGFIGTLGPSLALRMLSGRIEIDIGEAPAYLSRHEYPERDLGGPVQFVSHIGLGVLLIEHLALGYRFEHISNAHIYPFHNPGLNLHLLDLRYRF